jgi:recombinational DNA repair protein RecR
LKEIILGFAVNPDGENTARYIEMLLKDSVQKFTLVISHLGRGLSTGSELEYADPETIKNALKNRS